MNQSVLKRLLPHIIAYFVMMAISFTFFSPYVFEGKVLTQGDNVRARAMQGEMSKVRAETGEIPLWTNSMFGGMPTYQIQMAPGKNMTRLPYGLLFLRQSVTNPHLVVLVAMICCYLLLITLGVDWRIAIIGSVGFGLSNYQIDLAEAGHSTKMAAVALVPGMFAGAIMAYRGKYLLGGALFGLFVAMEILANHLQITFYAGLMLIILGIVQLVSAALNDTFPNFIKASAILIAMGVLGIAANADRIWATQEYAEETIRGKSQLSIKKGKSGLSKDNIFSWSYGIMESMTLIVPNFNGGGASQHFRGTETHDKIYRNMLTNFSQQGMPRDAAIKSAEQQVAATMYWGNQPFVGVAIYFGAVLIFLFFLGAILVPGEVKIWLVIAAIFTLMLAWGGNFPMNSLLVDYVPMFNKFRAVSMVLGLTHLAVVVLAVLGLQTFISDRFHVKKDQRALFIAAGISMGLCVLAFLLSFVLDFSNPAKDSRLPATLLSTILSDRASIMRMDALRSLFFIAISAGILYAFSKGKIKVLIAVLLVGALSVLDVWLVNKRILFSEKYETPKQASSSAVPTAADKQILADTDPHYRVLDLSRGAPFKSATASNFHKSIGGYHAAKLMTIQDVSERYLGPQYGQNPLEHLNILGMLNTKYVIQGGQSAPPQAVRLQEALGNVWLVDDIKRVDGADGELEALNKLNPKTTAVLRKSEMAKIDNFSIKANPADNIKLTSYAPDKLTYQYSTAADRLAVFSEIYYPPSKGWKMYLDGQPTDDFVRANYLLRAARLPPGQHTLEMRFEPRSFAVGGMIALICSLVLMLGFIGAVVLYFKNKTLPDPDQLGGENRTISMKKITKDGIEFKEMKRPSRSKRKPKR